ncbi:Cytadherence high molecular weight protein 3 [Wickerhamomyces ciferrii]|uniref:Cytadherence high molecular weight protein 3 n=1 Tax=Wickerhamomyces ciferrii (strain ATCC 14091 / BCRC 22168 / CBS 111 / JCM 3599 / NBRC 0793 / NRRL Y-1031 F-60-10) TaxID=1206466 RepID=K0KQ88_WICCF|nr:Cytadherence high molecular weight protein 3 [Wickerhamomyces ciferrii]CCH45211.1 Cytadherence high molecular weight protein 3 [Wickerhamomyces ciferrii]
MQAHTYFNDGFQIYYNPQHQNYTPGQQQFFENHNFVGLESTSAYENATALEDYNTSQTMVMQNINGDPNMSAQMFQFQQQQIYNSHPQLTGSEGYHNASLSYQEAAHDSSSQHQLMMNFNNDFSSHHAQSQFDSFPMISTNFVSDQQAYITPPFSNELAEQNYTTITGSQAQQQFQSQVSNKLVPLSGFPTIDTFNNAPISPIETPLSSPTSSSLESSQVKAIDSNKPQLATPVSPKKPKIGRRLSSPKISISSSRRSSVPNAKVLKPTVKRAATTPTLPSTVTSNLTQHTTQPGPIPATKPKIAKDPVTGEELLMFSYSKRKIIKNFSIKCPGDQQKLENILSTLPQEFTLENCVYPRAMGTEEEYKGNRYNYEKECNEIGWGLSWLNPELRNHRGLIQRAVDSWRNTRPDKKLRSRRVRKSELNVDK